MQLVSALGCYNKSNEQNISFGYRNILKRLFVAGELPTVKKGIYGEELKIKTSNKENQVTLEHIIPRAKKGKSRTDNYALATKAKNGARDTDDLLKHTTIENIVAYYQQFKGIDHPRFNGDEYIESGKKTFKKLGIDLEI